MKIKSWHVRKFYLIIITDDLIIIICDNMNIVPLNIQPVVVVRGHKRQ